MNIEHVDKNFIINNEKVNNVKYYNIKDKPISIHGVVYNNNLARYERMDDSVASSISGNLSFLNGCSSGGRIRFKTNSQVVSLKVFLGKVWGQAFHSKKMAVSFSLYVNNHFYKLFSPDNKWNMLDESTYESIINFEDKKIKNIDIYFPLYTFIKDVYVGINEESLIKAPKTYKYSNPVVFYGSSTTQGCCASRPGNSYPAFLSQSLGIDYLNLGFSGNGKAEKTMAEYISNLPMSVFVFDYDYNAETVGELKANHLSFYKIIRKSNPNLPIILMPKPNAEPNPKEHIERINVIKETFNYAKSNGDNHIYFIDNRFLYKGNYGYAHTVDGCHPNDLGFYLIARQMKPILRKILKESYHD